jgi:mannose-1-phosphate guanylyltransferase
MVALPKDSVAIIQGLDGYLVAVNKGVLLICKKENTSQLRKYFNDLQMKHGDEFI